MPVRKRNAEWIKTVHGGVTFAFADSALAFPPIIPEMPQ